MKQPTTESALLKRLEDTLIEAVQCSSDPEVNLTQKNILFKALNDVYEDTQYDYKFFSYFLDDLFHLKKIDEYHYVILFCLYVLIAGRDDTIINQIEGAILDGTKRDLLCQTLRERKTINPVLITYFYFFKTKTDSNANSG